MRGLWVILGLGVLGACRRDTLVFAPEPVIELAKVSPRVLPEYGNLSVVLRYKDGDGDLGGQPDGSPDLFLHDLRDSSRFPAGYDGILRYNMPRFYDGAPQSIQGTIEITVPGIVRLDPTAPAEWIVFEIYLKDRAGHESNRVRTDTIYIVP